MKVLHIFDHSIPLHSGYSFRSRAIILAQRANGIETVHLTTPKHNRDNAIFETVDGIGFYRTLPGDGLLSKLPLFDQWAVVTATEKRLPEIIEKERPDILHAHSPSLNGLAALRVAKNFKKLPVVYECRAFWEDAAVDHGTIRPWGPRYWLTRWLETYVFSKAQAVTTICEGLRQDITRRAIPAEKITVIPNGVNIEEFSTERPSDSDLANKLGINQKHVLGFIGSFYHYEGLHLLIDALPGINQRIGEVHLLLVGGGPEEERLKQRVNAIGIANYVTFVGRVPHEEVNRYYNLVDVFVYPRISMRLTDLVTPLKPLEAMAQGRIVVASNVGGHQELIRDGFNGHLFKAGSIESLTAIVVDLLKNKGNWPKFSCNGRAFVENERSWQRSCSPYRDIYTHLLGHASS